MLCTASRQAFVSVVSQRWLQEKILAAVHKSSKEILSYGMQNGRYHARNSRCL
jgi:hypothetical protein